MIENEYLHKAINKLSVVYAHLWLLHNEAKSNINDKGAIEIRDLCQDVIHKIDMFTREKQLAEKFTSSHEEVV